MKRQFTVQYEDGQFWVFDETFNKQALCINSAVVLLDILADGHKWSMAVGEKWMLRCACTKSIRTMLDHVKYELSVNSAVNVYVMTPDIDVMFYC